MPHINTMRTLSNDKILAHKRNGNHLVLLTQEAGSFFLIFARVIGKGDLNIKILAKKELSFEEAEIALMRLLESAPVAQLEGSTASDIGEVILLEDTSAKIPDTAEVVETHELIVSPYFPTKEIFLSHQMTCAPNSTK